MYKISELLDLSHTIAAPLFEGKDYPWEVLGGIKEFILTLGPALSPEEFDSPEEGVWIAKDAKVFPSAYIGAPCIIDHGAEVRHCAFIRGSAIVGKNCVVGNSVELKNAVLFDSVQVPHYNYVGGTELLETGLKKFGAILGDHVEVGCNSVLNPGTVLGREVSVYPTSSVRGVVPAGCIFKGEGNIVKRS